MRIFQLFRIMDKSGVSGTGIVAEGVEFSNGTCALCWLSDHPSVAIYNNISDIETLHGHSGMTRIMFDRPGNQASDSTSPALATG